MISPQSTIAVALFELKRAMTIPRLLWWAGLVMFPVGITLLVKANNGDGSNRRVNTVKVVEIDVSELSEGGLPTRLTVDGQELSGQEAIMFVREQTTKAWEAELEKMKQAWEERWSRRGRFGRRGPPSRPEPKPVYNGPMPERPVLLIRHPDNVSVGSLQLLKTMLEAPFSRVETYTASEPRPDVQPPSEKFVGWAGTYFALIPTMVAMMGVFLWATPAISGELERRSWIYLATRPNAAGSVLIGKYLVGVAWGGSAALVSAAVCSFLADTPEGFVAMFRPLALLVILGVPAYGAVYTLIGAIMPQRAMVIAFVYTVAFEIFISTAPALINKAAVQHHLRALWVRWFRLDQVADDANQVISGLGLSEGSTFGHVFGLALITLFGLTAALFVLRWKELSSADESET